MSGANRYVRLGKQAGRAQRQVDHSKLKMGVQMDDMAWKTMLANSLVLVSREAERWDWEVIMEILQGPLLNPRRMEEVLKLRWMERLLTFYKPSSRQFSLTKYTKVHGRDCHHV